MDHRAVGHRHRRLDRVLQLADVARPGVLQQRLHRLGVDLGDRRGAHRRELFEEVHRQQRDVLGPVAERRQVDPDHVQAVEEVGAEPAHLDLVLQPLVARGDDPDVDLDRLGPADPLERARLEHAEQLRLHRRRDVADLVEEQGAAVGELEPPFLAPIGAGERAPLVAEQLALEQ